MGLYGGFYQKDDRTERERYLEDELEREREAMRERDQREEKAREERRKEARERYEYDFRQADSWPEAFQKQATLCWREHNQFPPESEDDIEHFFERSALANEKALEIWREVSASKEAELEELQKQIDAVHESIRMEVADRLEQAAEWSEFKQTASAIRDDQLAGYLDW